MKRHRVGSGVVSRTSSMPWGVSHTATRVVQAIGRIFRSNTDHGVVMLVGPDLQSWVRIPKRQAHLPPLLQKQILLSNELTKKVAEGETTWPELIEGVLAGDDDWDELYQEYINQFRTNVSEPTAEWYITLLPQEQEAYDLLWQGHFGKAVDAYDSLASVATEHDVRLAAWYRHWRGIAYLGAGDRSRALGEFIKASNVRAELGRPSPEKEMAFTPPTAKSAGKQALNMAKAYEQKKSQLYAAYDQVDADLKYGPNTAKAEEALRLLGHILGLHSERPDKRADSGPDVLWTGDGDIPAWGFELKTDKQPSSEYTKKDDIGQSHNHEGWLNARYGPNAEIAIVGRWMPVSKQSDPSPRLRVIELDSFRDLLTRAKKAFEAVDAGDKSSLDRAFQTWIDYYGLNWPLCIESLDSRLASDLRNQE